MSGLTEQFVVLLMFSCLFVLSEGILKVTARPGEDVTLQCQKDTDESITVIKWDRPDLKSEGYVFLFTDNRPYEQNQLPSFRGRVELRDPEMKNGDTSVILKNVTVNDAGTYECFVVTGSTTVFSQSIILNVTESGHTAGTTEERGDEEGGNLTAPLVTAAVVICVVGLVGFVLWKHQRSRRRYSDPPPAAAELQTSTTHKI